MNDKTLDRQFEALLEAERPRLVQLCRRLAGDGDVADDLAQETMLEAWRQRHKLTDWHGANAWLSAIARNVWMRWRRRHGRERRHRVVAGATDESNILETLRDPLDVEGELERSELATLLDRALALLAPETRVALLAHYLDALPIAKIAARQGLHENALYVRLHRGKLTLRRALAADMREQALPPEQPSPRDDGWQATRLWCPLCGQQRLHSRFSGAGRHFDIVCPHCRRDPGGFEMNWHLPAAVGGAKHHIVMFRRLAAWSHTYFAAAIARRGAPCVQCGRMAALHMGVPATAAPYHHGIYAVRLQCPCCAAGPFSSLNGLVINHPAVQAFWRSHPRMRITSPRPVAIDGRPSLVVGCIALDGGAALDLLALQDTLEITAVNGTPNAPAG